MYKVIIIDDEPIIVKGLKEAVPWEKYGCEVVATAENGKEGIKLIREHKPHFIFSDIAMPKMDGLKMIAALKSQFPNMLVTILTGYRDFDYAQTAISLGVQRFLLKPSNMEEIEEAVSSMVKELQRAGSAERGAKGDKVSQASDFIVKEAIAYIEENYQEKVSLNDVAESTHVSQWHLSKLLNSSTGKSLSELLNDVRINKACEILLTTDTKISDLAEVVGFSDVAYFSRVFKKIIGMSPNEYRHNKSE